jgi:tetratricopeptide (TPR) repeat protein
VLGNAFLQKGRRDEAISEYQKTLELIKGAEIAEVSVKALIARAYAVCGKRSDAVKLLQEVTAASPYAIAGVYAALGDYDSAFEWLNKAYDQRDIQLVSLKTDPSLDSLRKDQRFDELVKRVGLPE